MKKSNLLILVISLILGLLFMSFQYPSKAEGNVGQDYPCNDKIIRFHVIANSDSTSDQDLKLKVRDGILEYISPKLNKCNSVEDARKVLKENDKEIIKIAKEVIEENSYSYNVNTTLSEEYFPMKSYGNIRLPQGRYEAYRIIIGNGEGQNWWCVMFPPLCFTDITRDEDLEKKSENKMEEMLSKEEHNTTDNQNLKNQSITIKFKTIEIFKKVFNS